MKFSSPVYSQASGSQDGTTYSHNRYGRYTRRRTTPTDPATAFQITQRNAFTALSTQWNGLSGSARAAWETYAANVPRVDALGNTVNLTGNAWFIACNQPRIAFLGATNVVTVAPTTFAMISLNTPTDAVATTSTATVLPNPADAWTANTNNALITFSSRQKSASVNFFKGPYQFAGSQRGTPSATLTLPFAATIGNKVFFAHRVLGVDGRISDLVRSSDVF